VPNHAATLQVDLFIEIDAFLQVVIDGAETEDEESEVAVS
jgi:hypothetical protein